MVKTESNDKRIRKPLLGFNAKKDSKSSIKNETIIALNPIARVAIMGRPNVGKSSLFNRLNKKNIAITSHISGSTRDINKQELRLQRFDILLIDTGGLEVVPQKIKNMQNLPKNSTQELKNENLGQEYIAKQIKSDISFHSYNVILQSDIILYVVSGNEPPLDSDIAIFRELSKQKETILVLNKVDNDKVELETNEFMQFGADFFAISVSHNRGITKLLSHIENTIQKLLDYKKIQPIKENNITELDFLDYFDDEERVVDNTENEISQEIKIGIIGRPNVGKSSLLNALIGYNRSLVSNIAGTTIDPVNEKITYKDNQITFIDTAGIRRRSKICGIEKYALDRTQKMLQQCDIALLVLDSSQDFVELDEKISLIASNNELGIIVVFNKWDIKKETFEDTIKVYKRKFKFLEYAPVVTVSSTTNRHIKELKDKIIEVYGFLSYRIPTAKLNTCIHNATKKHPIPSDKGKIVKIYYATQFSSNPPKIALIMNKPYSLHFSYKRYLINVLRDEFKFSGTPIILEARNKKSSDLSHFE